MTEGINKFLAIKKSMDYRDVESRKKAQKYLMNNILEIKSHRKVYTPKEIVKKPSELINISGVYLIYYISKNKVIFTYVGEATDVLKRWIQHINRFSTSSLSMYRKIRTKVKDIDNYQEEFNFLILKSEDNENKRLHSETANIFKFKVRSISINNKNCSWKLRCPNGHGKCRARLGYEIINEKLKLIVKAKCMNKTCDAFIIKY